MGRCSRTRSFLAGAASCLIALPGAAAAGESAVDSFNMTLLSNIDVYSGVNDCWGYTSGGTELAIYGYDTGTSFVDATDPQNPVEVFNLPGPSSIWRDIKTYQNYAYIVTEGPGAGAGIQIVDLSDPLNPVHVTTYTGSGYQTAHNIWIDEPNGIAYACGAVGGGMHVLSLANPVAPVQLSFFSSYYIHDLYVGNGRGYAGAIQSGSLRIMDTSNPSAITTLGSKFYSGAATHNAWPNSSGTHCFTSDETGGGKMRSWDITALPTITEVGSYEPTNEIGTIIHNVYVKNDMGFISHYKSGARVVDLTDPANPVEVGYYDTLPGGGGIFDGCWGMYPFRGNNGDIVYASDRQSGLYILEFTGGFAGDVSGQVVDGGAAPLGGATVDFVGNTVQFGTDGSGNYAGSLSGGTYEVITTLFGYEPDTSTVIVPENGSVVHNATLNALPTGTVEVTVEDARDGSPLPGAIVDFLNSPLTNNVSDASGLVSVAGVPAGIAWDVRVSRFGAAQTTRQVTPVAGSTVQTVVSVPPDFNDDFETNQGWIVGAGDDDASDGIWERAVPVPSSFLGPVGVDADATTGFGQAYVTENHVAGAFVGSSDVDNGKTTLLTPVFNGTGVGDLTLSYQRWFSNRAPSSDLDEFRVDVSTNGGGSWTNLETVNVGTDAWAAVSIDLTAAVPATATMQLRFVAEDQGGDTYVEAGLDDVLIIGSATDAQVPAAAAVSELRMAAPAPNPSREAATLSFQIPVTGPATVALYDVSGRRVATLLDGSRIAAGNHRVEWSGEDSSGRRVAPGVYFARLDTAAGSVSRRLVRLR